MTKKGLWLRVALVILSFSIIGCNNAAREKNAGPNEICLGVNLELSGKYGGTGALALRGMKMAVQEVNEKGGIRGLPVRLVVGDNKSDPATAQAIFEQQVKEEHVVAVLGPKNSDTAISLGQRAGELKTPFIATNATHPRVTLDDSGRTKPYAFRACFTDPFQGTAMAAFASVRLNGKRAALYVDTLSEYSQGIGSFFEKEFIKRGGVIVYKNEYRGGETDFGKIKQELKNDNVDLVFIPGFSIDVSRFIPQARKAGFEGPIVGGDAWDIDTIRQLIGDSHLKNLFYADMFSADDNNIRVTEFKQKFMQLSEGRMPNAAAVLGYDATLVLLDAVKRADSVTGEGIRAALEQTKDIPGVSGTISMNRKHDVENSIIVMGVANGRSVFLERSEAEH